LSTNVRFFSNGRHVESVEDFAALFEKATSESTEASVADLVGSDPLVVISVADCSKCEELAGLLAVRGVPSSVFVKWDKASPEYPALKESLAQHAGDVFSFPQVFSGGAYQGGFSEVVQKLEVGEYDELFEQEFNAEPQTVQRWIQKQPMVVFSLPNCPQCDELYGILEERKVPAKDIYIKLDKAWPQYQCLKRQIIKLIQQESFTFPQAFVRGEYQGGFHTMAAKVKDGELANVFAEEYGVALPLFVAPTTQAPPQCAISFDEDF